MTDVVRIVPDAIATSGARAAPPRTFTVAETGQAKNPGWLMIERFSFGLCTYYALSNSVCRDVGLTLYRSAQDWNTPQAVPGHGRPRRTGEYVIDSAFAIDTSTATSWQNAWRGQIRIGGDTLIQIETDEPLAPLRALVEQLRRVEIPLVSARLESMASQVIEQMAQRREEDVDEWVARLTEQLYRATD